MRALIMFLITAVVLFPLTANGIDVSGDQWGTWTRENSPYNVVGEIRVPPESTLVIEPGVLVNFQGHYKFIVEENATLRAVAEQGDSIIFTPADTATGWHGIRFMDASSNSRIGYCRLEYGKATDTYPDPDACGGAIYCIDSNPEISNNTIRNNWATRGGGVDCYYSSPTISSNTITDNRADRYGSGIYCSHSGLTISRNFISENRNKLSDGGGIYCDHIYGTISNNTISQNSATYGGGIYCWYSSVTIRDNVISGNSGLGAGIYCYASSPMISNNTIWNNSSSQGGGVGCFKGSNPTISNNIIISNSASQGAGIYSRDSSPTISTNTIMRNSAGGVHCLGSHPIITANTIWANRGRGIYCNYSSPTISSNIISENKFGGIYCYDHSSPTIANNIISGNSTKRGGGVSCRSGSSPRINNNTISGNSAEDFGGGIYCDYYSSATITNTILWGDTAPSGPEIYVESSTITVIYSDVQGGWPGVGNIDADPIFVGLEREDFYLRWRSPCIDAGDPNSPLDPDNTICDMGRFYFNQDVMGVVELYPHDEPIVIPSGGGQLVYDGWVFNFIGHPGRADIWTYAFVPGIGRYGPIDLYSNFRIPPDSIGMNDIRKNVPGLAPQGDYTFVAYVGSYPSTIIDSSYFYFRKSGSAGGGITGWFEGTEWLKVGDLAESNLPGAYALSQNYPNPFNATTVIEYTLPVESHVKLQVYNIRGQKVATLVDSKQQAGYRSVNWDASGVSSGLYFYRLTAGSKVFSERMMLLK